MPQLHFPDSANTVASLRLPDELKDPGLLVGWSLEHRRPTRPIGFTYGEPDKVPSTGYIDPIQLAQEGHLITIAPTGAGKGRGCIIPALLQHDGPLIVIDPKGENAAITARYRREMGHEVFVLDPMRITNEPDAAFNPLDIVDIESPLAVDDVAAIASGLWPDTIDARDRFWVGRAQQVTIGLLLHLLADYPPAMRNFAGLRELIAKTINNPPEVLQQLASSRNLEARTLGAALTIPAPETLGGILSFAQELVDFLRGPLVQEATCESSFDINGITRGDPYTIFLVLPPHMLESHGRLLRVWISALLSLITRRRAKPPKSTLFILDEAAQLGPLSQLRQAITLLRGYGVQTWSFWQDVSQLKMLYPQDWATMINNCRVLQCFGALNMSAAGDMAALTGIGTPEYVLSLEPNEMILQLAGDEAVVARLPDYLKDPPFAKRFDTNPYYKAGAPILPISHPPIRPYERKGVADAQTPVSEGAAQQALFPASPAGMPEIVRRRLIRGPVPGEDVVDPLLARLLAMWAE